MKSFILILFVLGAPFAFAQDATNQTQLPADETTVEQISSDGTIKVRMQSNLPKTGNALSISVKFLDAADSPMDNVNYDIVAIQNGEQVLSETGAFAKNGKNKHMTSVLNSNSHVEVMVVLQGVGETLPLSGPIGETVEVRIVPEFGSIVTAALTLATTLGIILPRVMCKK